MVRDEDRLRRSAMERQGFDKPPLDGEPFAGDGLNVLEQVVVVLDKVGGVVLLVAAVAGALLLAWLPVGRLPGLGSLVLLRGRCAHAGAGKRARAHGGAARPRQAQRGLEERRAPHGRGGLVLPPQISLRDRRVEQARQVPNRPRSLA